MPSPFPGMDPYIEACGMWADFHSHLIEKISVQLGDSDLPPAPVAGGSNTTASVCNVVAKASDLRVELLRRPKA